MPISSSRVHLRTRLFKAIRSAKPEFLACIANQEVWFYSREAVQLQGSLAVVSNLPKFGEALRLFIDRMVPKPSTDQEFADAEAECKTLKKPPPLPKQQLRKHLLQKQKRLKPVLTFSRCNLSSSSKRNKL